MIKKSAHKASVAPGISLFPFSYPHLELTLVFFFFSPGLIIISTATNGHSQTKRCFFSWKINSRRRYIAAAAEVQSGLLFWDFEHPLCCFIQKICLQCQLEHIDRSLHILAAKNHSVGRHRKKALVSQNMNLKFKSELLAQMKKRFKDKKI